MSFKHFDVISKPVPTPMLLVTIDGCLLAHNQAASDQLKIIEKTSRLEDIFAPVNGEIFEYLRMCSRTKEPMPGAFTLESGGGRQSRFSMRGMLYKKGDEENPTQLLLHAEAKDGYLREFLLLNQKIKELSREINRRIQLEEERAQLLNREKEARQNAERLYVEAQRASRAKDEFLATVSHELRTPLNAIAGWAEMLVEGEVDDEMTDEAYRILHRNAQTQVKVVNDLIDISRAISGKISFSMQPVNPAEVLSRTIEAITPAAAAKQIQIESNLELFTGLIQADEERLQQALWNILSNAVKFGHKGGLVKVDLARTNSKVEMHVSDNGEGIDSGFLPYVFDRFLQEDGSMTRTHGGLGLGLALTRHIIEQHGGDIRVESEGKGHGSKFTVHLPLMAIDIGNGRGQGSVKKTAIATDHTEENEGKSLSGLKILVVDDEPDALHLLAKVLRRYGASVMLASSAKEALQEVVQWHPDVLLSDIGMPEEDGYSLMRKVTSLVNNQREDPIRALALTAYSRQEDRRKAIEAGFQRHLVKPVKPKELVQNIMQAVSH